MQLRIEIDSVPCSAILNSIQIQKQLAGRSSTASFNIPVLTSTGAYYDASDYDDANYDDGGFTFTALPQQQSEVIIYNDVAGDDTDTKVFRGFVTSVSRQQKNRVFQVWQVSCNGIEYLLGTQVLNKTYTGSTDRLIIQDAFGTLLPEITTADATVAELSVDLDYEAKDQTLRDLLEALSTITGAEYRVTEEKELSYRAAGSVSAAFGFGSDPDDLHSPPLKKWITSDQVRHSENFANSVTVLGAFTGTGGAELRSTAQNTGSISTLGLRQATVVSRDVDNQPALDLAAEIELESRAVQQSITFDFFEDGLQVGDLVLIDSLPAGISGSYVINTLTLKQTTQTRTRYTAIVGDQRFTLADEIRQLDRIKNGPKLQPAVPPPSGSITSDMLGDHVVTRLKIAAAAVSEAELEIGAVTDSILAAGAVTTTKIADDAISTPKLQAGSVVAATLAAGSVVAGKIAASSITGVEINAGSITAADAVFASGAIQSADIGTAQILSANIGSAQVGDAQIGSITADHLTSGSIDASVITVSNITADAITTGTLDAARIATGSISGVKLTDGTIGDIKITSGLDATKITTGTLDASVVTVTNLDATSITTGTLDCSALTVTNLDAGAISGGTITAAISINSGGSFLCDDTATFNNGLICHGLLSMSDDITMAGHQIGGASQIGGVVIFAGEYQDATGTRIIDSGGNFIGASVNVSTGAITGGSLTIGGHGFGVTPISVSAPSFSTLADAQAWCAGLASALSGLNFYIQT